MAIFSRKTPTPNPGPLSGVGVNSQDYQRAMQQMQQMQQMAGIQNLAAQQSIQRSALSQYAARMYPGAVEPKFKPSKHYSNTMGWRSWVWDITANELRSPQQGTAWNGTELRCETWDESAVIRGAAGIHAHLVPDDWHKLVMDEAPNGGLAYAEQRGGKLVACIAIQGLVERFGKFVLGTEGWRAEWVQIRKLAAATDEIGLALERAFPDVEIIYGNR